MDEEGLNILKEIYFSTTTNPRIAVKEKYGIEKLKKVERGLIQRLLREYLELKGLPFDKPKENS